jgi:hypothetical protein
MSAFLEKDWMNPLAITGYSILLIFTLYKLKDTNRSPADFLANIFIIAGLSALIMYHARLMKTKKDEKQDQGQRNLRLTAHSTIVAFLLITLLPISLAKFQFYDWFALIGHSSLFVSVYNNLSQLLGVGLLALYFFFAGGRKFLLKRKLFSMEALNLLGRFLMFVYFTIAFVNGVRAM